MAEYIDKQQILEKAKEYQHNPFGIPLIITEIEKTDGVEVKHGEWIAHNKTMYGSDYSCSLCGNIADEDNRGKFAILTKYCSNCGAKMDGGKANG